MAWPTVDDLARWVNVVIPTPDETALLEQIVAVVPDAVRQYCDRPFDEPSDLDDVPPNVAEAALLWEGRLWQRRNSLDGTLGFGDSGIARVGGRDPDVDRLLAPYKRSPVA